MTIQDGSHDGERHDSVWLTPGWVEPVIRDRGGWQRIAHPGRATAAGAALVAVYSTLLMVQGERWWVPVLASALVSMLPVLGAMLRSRHRRAPQVDRGPAPLGTTVEVRPDLIAITRDGTVTELPRVPGEGIEIVGDQLRVGEVTAPLRGISPNALRAATSLTGWDVEPETVEAEPPDDPDGATWQQPPLPVTTSGPGTDMSVAEYRRALRSQLPAGVLRSDGTRRSRRSYWAGWVMAPLVVTGLTVLNATTAAPSGIPAAWLWVSTLGLMLWQVGASRRSQVADGYEIRVTPETLEVESRFYQDKDLVTGHLSARRTDKVVWRPATRTLRAAGQRLEVRDLDVDALRALMAERGWRLHVVGEDGELPPAP